MFDANNLVPLHISEETNSSYIYPGATSPHKITMLVCSMETSLYAVRECIHGSFLLLS